MEPFKIFGNLYFVGEKSASTHIVDTGSGLIMFDSGYRNSLHLLIDKMYRLGLDPYNIKYIFHTHGHIDHIQATAELVNLTGAKTFIGEEDKRYVNGELDLTYAKELGMNFTDTFEPDILLHEGDEITLGNTTVKCISTPGHTPGAMSFLFNVSNGKKEYIAGLHGGMGTNTMCAEFLDKYGISYDCREKFLNAMDRLSMLRVDIFLGNHADHNKTEQKYKELINGNANAFIVENEWSTFALWAKNNLINMIAKEKQNET